MDFKASKGGKRSLTTRNKKLKYPEKAVDAGEKTRPALCVTPKKSISPGISVVRSSRTGKTTFIRLIPAGCCSCHPPKKSRDAKAPLHPKPFKKKASSCFSSLHPLPVEDGWMDGLDAGRALCAGKPRVSQRRFCLLARLGLQCSPSKPLDQFPFAGGGWWQMSQRLPPARGGGGRQARMRRRGSCMLDPDTG